MRLSTCAFGLRSHTARMRRPRKALGLLDLEWQASVYLLRPTLEELNSMIVELSAAVGGTNRLSRMAGIPARTLVAWRDRGRVPSEPARRCVWLLWALLLHPERCRTLYDVATWGRYRVKPACGLDTPIPSGPNVKCAESQPQDGNWFWEI